MTSTLRKMRALGSFGLAWAIGFVAVAMVAMTIISATNPRSVGSGDNPLGIAAAMGLLGMISGVAFGAIFGLAESRKKILELSVMRVAVWGALGAAAFPFLTGMEDKLAILTSPLGALFAGGTVAAVKRLERRDTRFLTEDGIRSKQPGS